MRRGLVVLVLVVVCLLVVGVTPALATEYTGLGTISCTVTPSGYYDSYTGNYRFLVAVTGEYRLYRPQTSQDFSVKRSYLMKSDSKPPVENGKPPSLNGPLLTLQRNAASSYDTVHGCYVWLINDSTYVYTYPNTVAACNDAIAAGNWYYWSSSSQGDSTPIVEAAEEFDPNDPTDDLSIEILMIAATAAGYSCSVTGYGFGPTAGDLDIVNVAPTPEFSGEPPAKTWGNNDITFLLPIDMTVGSYRLTVTRASDGANDSKEFAVVTQEDIVGGSEGFWDGIDSPLDFLKALLLPSKDWSGIWNSLKQNVAVKFPFCLISAIVDIQSGYIVYYGGSGPGYGTPGAPKVTLMGHEYTVSPTAILGDSWGPDSWAFDVMAIVLWFSFVVAAVRRFMPRMDT